MSFMAKSDRQRSAFVYNDRMFNAFNGTIELKEKLRLIEVQNRRVLDSLVTLSVSQINTAVISQEKSQREAAVLELSERYTADIWKHINQSLATYGREHGYDFIFGASGDGGIMYAKEAGDITDDVIRYINLNYEGVQKSN